MKQRLDSVIAARQPKVERGRGRRIPRPRNPMGVDGTQRHGRRKGRGFVGMWAGRKEVFVDGSSQQVGRGLQTQG